MGSSTMQHWYEYTRHFCCCFEKCVEHAPLSLLRACVVACVVVCVVACVHFLFFVSLSLTHIGRQKKMLAIKQSKSRFLCNVFMKSDCARCLGIACTAIAIIGLCFVWFQGNIWLSRKGYFDRDVVSGACLFEICILYIAVIIVCQMISLVRLRTEFPNLTWTETWHKSRFGEPCAFLFVVFVICLVIYGMYCCNYAIAVHYNDSNMTDIAVYWTFVEIGVVPLIIGVVVILKIVYFIWLLVIDTLKLMSGKSKVYDVNAELVHAKDIV